MFSFHIKSYTKNLLTTNSDSIYIRCYENLALCTNIEIALKSGLSGTFLRQPDKVTIFFKKDSCFYTGCLTVPFSGSFSSSYILLSYDPPIVEPPPRTESTDAYLASKSSSRLMLRALLEVLPCKNPCELYTVLRNT